MARGRLLPALSLLVLLVNFLWLKAVLGQEVADGCSSSSSSPLTFQGEDEVTLFQLHHHRHKARSVAALDKTLSSGHSKLDQDPVTETTTESWFERMSDSMGDFVIGWVLLVFSIPILWFNESRNAQMESIINLGRSSVRSVEGKTAEDYDNNWLVHVEGAQMHGAARVADRQFDVAFDTGCIKLRSCVEVYQVIEHAQKKQKEKLGGGKETITTYTYTEGWSNTWHDSGKFHDARQRGRNKKPQGLDVVSFSQTCSRVEYGGGFLLSEALTEQCHEFKSATEKLGEKVRLKSARIDFTRSGEHYYHGSRGGGQQEQVGDARVSFQYVPDGPASVMALQVEQRGDTRATFMPYRLIPRPWFFSLSESDEKKALRAQAKKSSSQLADDSLCTGCLALLCCACNLVICCFASFLTPEINHLYSGSLDEYECFKRIQSETSLLKWGLRFGGWFLMFTGLYMLFSPFLTLITVIPLLGPFFASLGGWLIWFLCLFGTLLLATVIVIIAYLFYHPLMAMLYAIGATAVIVGMTFLMNILSG